FLPLLYQFLPCRTMAGDGSYALVRQMMAMPFCHMHGLEHHVSVPYHNAVDSARNRRAGIQCDNSVPIVRGKVRVVVKLAAPALIMRMAERAMPVAANDCLAGFRHTAVGGFHAVQPPGSLPCFRRSSPPVVERGILNFVSSQPGERTGDPAVHKNVVRCFIIVLH